MGHCQYTGNSYKVISSHQQYRHLKTCKKDNQLCWTLGFDKFYPENIYIAADTIITIRKQQIKHQCMLIADLVLFYHWTPDNFNDICLIDYILIKYISGC